MKTWLYNPPPSMAPGLFRSRRRASYNSEYPATLRSAQIAPFGRNFGYSRNVI
ncbi:MAG: hypothetical protein JXK07_10195 [Spirochaetes bacterium]|nr:hypothetical protein [Spirochaetota bacterium]